MRRARLERRRLRQPDETVAEQPSAGVRASHDSEERAGNRLRSKAAGQAALSTEVCNEPMQVEVGSRTRAADTAIEDLYPRMKGSEGTADNDVTTADGHVSAGHGTIPWESALSAKDMWLRWMLRNQCRT